MVARKSTRKGKAGKLGVKKQTLKDLEAGSKAKAVKGGSLVDCRTRIAR